MSFPQIKSEILMLIDKRDYQKAKKLCLGLLENEKIKANHLKFAYRKLCVIGIKNSDFRSVENWAEKAVDFEPKNLVFQTKLLVSKYNLGKLDEAMVIADYILEKDPEHNKASIVKGEILLAQKNIKEAEKFYSDLNIAQNLELSISLAKKPLYNNDWKSSLKKHQELITEFPESLEAHFELSNFYSQHHFTEQAQFVLKQIQEKFGNSIDLLIMKGDSLIASRDFINGINYLKKAYKQDPKPNLAYKIANNLSYIQSPEAIDYIKKIASPTKRAIAIANMHSINRNYKEELRELEEVISDDLINIHLATAHLTSLLNLYKMDEFHSQLARYKEYFPNNQRIDSLALKSSQTEGRYEDSIKEIKSLMIKHPENQHYNLSLAHNYVQLGKRAEARDVLIKYAEVPYSIKSTRFIELLPKAFGLEMQESWEEMIEALSEHLYNKKDILIVASILEFQNFDFGLQLLFEKILSKNKTTEKKLVQHLLTRIEAKKILRDNKKEDAQIKLSQLRSRHAAGSLGSKVLDTNLNPFIAIEIVDQLKHKIKFNEGYALFRIVNSLDEEDLKNIDCLGLPDQRFVDCNSDLSNILSIQNTIVDKLDNRMTLVSSQICYDLDYWGLFDYLLSELNTCSVVSSNFFIRDYIRQQFLVEVDHFQLYNVPSVFDTDLTETLIFEDLDFQVKPGELVFVDAGANTLRLCLNIKQQGGIAIDIGGLAKNWFVVNKKISSFFNLRFLSANEQLASLM